VHGQQAAKSEQQAEEMAGEMELALEAARQAWEKEQLALGVRASLESNAEVMRQKQASQAIIAQRLLHLGRERMETAALGDCLFEAIPMSAGLCIDHLVFRTQVVDYLRQLAPLFRDHIEQRFRDYDQYLDYMAREGSWGDDLCVQAASHLLLRPIHVITDAAHEDDSVISYYPPHVIDQSVWGAEVVIAYIGYRHYEITMPKAPAGSIKAKEEKSNS
jgi:hypothetical protein